MSKETLEQRIERERKELNLPPWGLAPSEVSFAPSPWPPGTAGYDAWHEAQRMRRDILKRDPHYFD